MQHSEDVDCFSINSSITRWVQRHWNMTIGVGKLASTFLIMSLACSNQQFPQTYPGCGLAVREVKEVVSKGRLLPPFGFRTNLDMAAPYQLTSTRPVNVLL